MKKYISFLSLFAIILVSLIGLASFSSKAQAQNIGSLQSIVTPGFSFRKDLQFGDTDPDVLQLQKVLNADIDTTIAVQGDGSRGHETTYFGSLTKVAVIKFQEKYRDSILTPNGLTTGNGSVGRATRTKLNLLVGVMITNGSVGSVQSRAGSGTTYVAPATTIPAPSNQAGISVCQFVNLLISIGVIPSANANQDLALMGCTANNNNSTAFVDLKVNGSNGPITVVANSAITLSWTSSGVVSCSSGSNSKPVSGSQTVTMGTVSQAFNLVCLTASGASLSDSVSVNVTGETPVATTTNNGVSPILLNTGGYSFGYSLAIFNINTNVPTRAYVTYWTNPNSSSSAQTASFTSLQSSHSEIITGLTPNTVYYFTIRIVDANGNSFTSGQYTAATSNNPADNSTTTTPVNPAASSTLTQKVLYSNDGAGVVAIYGSDSLKTTSKVTLEAWVKPTRWSSAPGISNTRDQVIISKGSIGGNIDYALTLDNGKLVYSNNDASLWTCSPVVPLNQWTHVAVAIDEMTQRVDLYVNGTKMGTSTVAMSTTSVTASSTPNTICEGRRGVFSASSKINRSNAITNSASSYIDQPAAPIDYSTMTIAQIIAAANNLSNSLTSGISTTSNVHIANFYPKTCSTVVNHSNGFIGSIDDVRIWNIARTDQQIRDNMRLSVKGASGLIGYYTFDDGSATDVSSYSNNGAVKGSLEIVDDTTATSTVVGPNFNLGPGFILSEPCDPPPPPPPPGVEVGVRTQFAGFVAGVSPCYTDDNGSTNDRFKWVYVVACKGQTIVSQPMEVNSATGEPTGGSVNANQYLQATGPVKFLWDSADGNPLPKQGNQILGTANPKSDETSGFCPGHIPAGTTAPGVQGVMGISAQAVSALMGQVTNNGGWLISYGLSTAPTYCGSSGVDTSGIDFSGLSSGSGGLDLSHLEQNASSAARACGYSATGALCGFGGAMIGGVQDVFSSGFGLW